MGLSAPAPAIEIDEALNNGWFEDWYQPKIDLKRKCLAGAEASACIRHPLSACSCPAPIPAARGRAWRA